MENVIGSLMEYKGSGLPNGSPVFCVIQKNDGWAWKRKQTFNKKNKPNSSRSLLLISFKEPILIIDYWQYTKITAFYIALYGDQTVAIPDHWINVVYHKVNQNE
jgi:hypothetical protein